MSDPEVDTDLIEVAHLMRTGLTQAEAWRVIIDRDNARMESIAAAYVEAFGDDTDELF